MPLATPNRIDWLFLAGLSLPAPSPESPPWLPPELPAAPPPVRLEEEDVEAVPAFAWVSPDFRI